MLSESALIGEVKKRNKRAMEELHGRYAGVLLGICMRYCGSLADAEDVLHDAFLRILAGIDTFTERQNCSFEGWLKKVTVNTALNYLRKKSRMNFLIDLDESLENLSDNDQGTVSVFDVAGNLTIDQILQMVCELPVGYRTVFNMYVFEDFSHKEIALELNCSESTSKTQLFKARAILQRKIMEAIGKEAIEI
jgi:RNA polymerase sigma-70 factor, ECF subfamily